MKSSGKDVMPSEIYRYDRLNLKNFHKFLKSICRPGYAASKHLIKKKEFELSVTFIVAYLSFQ